MRSVDKNIAEEVKKSDEKSFSFFAVLSSFSEFFSPRMKDMVWARFALSGGRVKTLEEIGKSYGITRERVRQILAGAFSAVKQRREDPRFGEIALRIEEALRGSSGILSVEGLFSQLAGGSKKEHGALAFFLECLKSVKEEKETDRRVRVFVISGFPYDEWDNAHDTAYKILADSGQALDETEFFALAKKAGVSVGRKTFFDYLAVSSTIGKNVFYRWGLLASNEIRPRGTREKAYLILKMHGSPLHFKDIASRIDKMGLQRNGRTTHPQTVHNELIKDKKFVLIGRGLYALSEWGYKRGTVREVLGDILKKNGSPMKREEILDRVFRVRHVKRSTVIINLNAFFEKVGKDEYTVKH